MHLSINQILKHPARYYWVLSLVLSISACGDGNQVDSGILQAPLLTRDAHVIVASAYQTTSLINTVASPFGAAKTGQPVPISTVTTASTLFFGLNADGEPMLMGFGSNSTELSADSTATALTKISQNLIEIPDGVARTMASDRIVDASSYRNLVAEIEASLANGISPLASSKIIDTANQVAYEASLLASNVTALQATYPRASATSRPVTASPFHLWNHSATDKIWLTEQGTQPNDVTLNNRTFLKWTIVNHIKSSTTESATTVYANPLQSTLLQYLAFYGGSESKTNVSGSEYFTFDLLQDKTALNYNAAQAFTQLTFAIVDILLQSVNAKPTVVQTCTVKIANTLINKSEFATLVSEYSDEALTAYLKSLVISIPSLLTSCNSPDDSEEYIRKVGNESDSKGGVWLGALGKVGSAFALAKSASFAYGVFSQLSMYSNYSESFEVCRYSGVIAPCIAKLSGASISLRVGTNSTPSIQAYDRNGSLLGLPTGLLFASDNESVFKVVAPLVGIGPSLQPVSAGEARLLVTDQVTGINISIPVIVDVSNCSVTGNKLLNGLVTASMPAYDGILQNIADGSSASGYANFAAFAGSVSIEINSAQCFSQIEILPTMTPSGQVNQSITLFDSTGNPIGTEDISGNFQNQEPKVISLTHAYFGVKKITITVENSSSWIGWFEISGY